MHAFKDKALTGKCRQVLINLRMFIQRTLSQGIQNNQDNRRKALICRRVATEEAATIILLQKCQRDWSENMRPSRKHRCHKQNRQHTGNGCILEILKFRNYSIAIQTTNQQKRLMPYTTTQYRIKQLKKTLTCEKIITAQERAKPAVYRFKIGNI